MASGNKDNTIMLILSSTVMVILAIAFLSSIADQTAVNTEMIAVNSESHDLTGTAYTNSSINTSVHYTVTNAPTNWKTEDCPLTSVRVTYQNGTPLTETTDYVFNSNYGNYTLKDTKASQQLVGNYNKTYVDYKYCADNYVSSSWGRTILNTNTGLVVIAILSIGILLVYSLLGKESRE